MLRSQFRSLRPQEKQTLRHWVLEFVVVVVGVLLALLAAEWADTRRDKAEAEQAVGAMARELQMISSVMYFGLQGWECQKEQIERLYSALMDTEAPWDPEALVVEEVDTDRSERSSLPVYFDDSPYIRHSSARENAESMGALQKLPVERAISIAFLYSIADTAYDANYKRYEKSRALTALSLKEPPSLAERRQLLGTLGEIYEQHDLFLRYARGVLGNWDQFPEKPETMPAEWKILKQLLREREEKLGDCAFAPTSDYFSGLLAE
jgi:type II secretory pathway pseudopilin PulG